MAPVCAVLAIMKIKKILLQTKKVMCQDWNTFCEKTTLHGVKYLTLTDLHWLERIFWLVAVFMACYWFVFCSLNQIRRYQYEPIVVLLSRDYRNWWTPFPAITTCFTNRIDHKKADRAIERIWNVTKESDENMYNFYKLLIYDISEVSFRSTLQNFWKYESGQGLEDVDLLQLAWHVHPEIDLKITSTQTKEPLNWTPVMTEMGICFTTNSLYDRFQAIGNTTELAKNNNDILKCHYNSATCQIRVTGIKRTARFFIHSPWEVPDEISSPTPVVRSGGLMDLDVKLIEIQASEGVEEFPSETRKCKYSHEAISKNVKAYSYGLCLMNCRIQIAMVMCGCRPFFHFGGEQKVPVCDALGMNCIARFNDILIKLPTNLANCTCVPSCTQLNFYTFSKKMTANEDEQEEDPDYADEEDIKVTLNIDLKKPKYRLKREILFTFQDLMASIGGISTLFIGASIITTMEVICYVCNIVIKLILCLIGYNLIKYPVKEMS